MLIKTNTLLKKLSVILAMVAISYQAYATTNNFTNGSSHNGNNNWSTATNWSLSHVPLSGEDVTLDGTQPWGFINLDNTGLVCNNLTISNGGQLLGNGSSVLTVSGSLTDGNSNGAIIPDVLTITGNFAIGIMFDDFSNSGIGSTVTVAGNITVETTNWSLRNGSTFILNGTTQSFAASNKTPVFDNLIIASGVTTFSTAGTGNSSAINVDVTLTVSTGAELIPSGDLVEISNANNGGTITGGGTLDILHASGFFDDMGETYIKFGTYDLGNMTLKYISGSSSGFAQIIWGSDAFSESGGEVGNYSAGSINIDNTEGVNLDDITIDGNLVLTAGNCTPFSGVTINIGGNITGTGSNYVNNGETVILNGSSAQQIQTPVTFNNLTVGNTGGVTDFGSTIAGTLTLTTGVITEHASDVLNFSSIAPYSGGSNSSYVDAPVTNNSLSATNTSFVFPTGNAGIYEPIGVSGIGSITTFKAQYTRAVHTASTTGIGGSAKASIEYWTLTQTGSSSADVTLIWEDGTYAGITNLSDLRIYNDHSSGTWSDLGQSSNTGTTSAGSITVNTVPSADFGSGGFFTFGDNNGVNPLPVSLLSFSAQYQDNHVNLNWGTASEQNNDYFGVERSTDAANWTNIGQVEGHGTTNITNNYSDIDNLAGIVPSGNIYYRLKQVDFNGDFTYSMVRSVTINNPVPVVSTYPNPANSILNVNWTSNSDNNVVLKLMNSSGVNVYEQNVSGKGVMQKQIDMSALPTGLYFVQLIGCPDIGVVNQSIVKQ